MAVFGQGHRCLVVTVQDWRKSEIEAQHLVILSTAPGLIDMKGTKEIVPVVERITPEIEAMAGGTTDETATGGMISKISAGELHRIASHTLMEPLVDEPPPKKSAPKPAKKRRKK